MIKRIRARLRKPYQEGKSECRDLGELIGAAVVYVVGITVTDVVWLWRLDVTGTLDFSTFVAGAVAVNLMYGPLTRLRLKQVHERKDRKARKAASENLTGVQD